MDSKPHVLRLPGGDPGERTAAHPARGPRHSSPALARGKTLHLIPRWQQDSEAGAALGRLFWSIFLNRLPGDTAAKQPGASPECRSSRRASRTDAAGRASGVRSCSSGHHILSSHTQMCKYEKKAGGRERKEGRELQSLGDYVIVKTSDSGQ